MLQVILKDHVDNLGQAGDIVRVRPGYARNFLYPHDLAAPADKGRVKELEHNKQAIASRMRRLRTAAQVLADRITTMTILIEAQVGEGDRMFGSITAHDIAVKLADQGIQVDRRKVMLEHPIRNLGAYQVDAKLEAGVTARVTVWVVRPGETEPPPPPAPVLETPAVAEAAPTPESTPPA